MAKKQVVFYFKNTLKLIGNEISFEFISGCVILLEVLIYLVVLSRVLLQVILFYSAIESCL
jgi:hypothetical protein